MRTALKYHSLSVKWWLKDNAAPMMILGALLVVVGLVQLGRALLPARPITMIINATATPALQLLPTAEASGLPRSAVAYDQPVELGGRVLGALDAGRPYEVLSRYGAGWLQLDAGSGPVWVLGAEAGLVVDAALVDLQPAPTPEVVYVVEVREQAGYAPPVAPQPAPAEPASGAAEVSNAAVVEASHRAAGGVFTVSSVGESRQAGPVQCTNNGRSCLGRKP